MFFIFFLMYIIYVTFAVSIIFYVFVLSDGLKTTASSLSCRIAYICI